MFEYSTRAATRLRSFAHAFFSAWNYIASFRSCAQDQNSLCFARTQSRYIFICECVYTLYTQSVCDGRGTLTRCRGVGWLVDDLILYTHTHVCVCDSVQTHAKHTYISVRGPPRVLTLLQRRNVREFWHRQYGRMRIKQTHGGDVCA